jgi:drug/metabolite transporter (DMT)-like permease
MFTSNLLTPKLVQGAVIILAVIAVAIADVMLKRATSNGSLWTSLRSPWLFIAVGLYLLQIGLFVIAFIAGWKLSIIGALQTALYAMIVLAAGVFLYHEDLTRLQVFGILMAFSGVVMINWPK